MTSRLDIVFDRLRHIKRAALIPYIMAGDPSIEDSLSIALALADNGADILEIGFPFSDPTADGPSIQAAAGRALQAGTTLNDVIQLCARFRAKNDNTPLVLMGYLNPVLQYGYGDFALALKHSGVDAIIIVDLPPEEEHELLNHIGKTGVKLVRLIAPTTQGERLEKLLSSADGFIYNIAIKGITGSGSADKMELLQRLKTVRSMTSKPVVTGFGINNEADVKLLADKVDGVVIGSALVNLLHNAYQKDEHLTDIAADFAARMSQATIYRTGLLGKLRRLL